MIFYLDNKSKKYTNGFMRFLIYNMRLEFSRKISHEQADRWDDYLNDKEASKLDFSNKHIRTLNILYLGINRLVFRKYKDLYLIEIKPFANIPGTNERISDVCNLINYGTMDIQPYPIFSEVFSSVEKKLDKLYRLYNGG